MATKQKAAPLPTQTAVIKAADIRTVGFNIKGTAPHGEAARDMTRRGRQ